MRYSMKNSVLLIQPEKRKIHRLRRGQLNNFSQITMPYLAVVPARFLQLEGRGNISFVSKVSARFTDA